MKKTHTREPASEPSGGARPGAADHGPAQAKHPRRQLDKRPVPVSSGDRRLVTGCLRGDQQAWAAIIDKYQRLIYSIPIKYGGSPEDAADIFQAVCLELFAELSRLRNTDNLRPWLMTVTAHEALRWKRKRQRQLQNELEGLDQEALGNVALPPVLTREAELEQMVREAAARLSARCRELIRMLFYEQPPRPYAQIAETLGLARGSIGFIRGRCLKRLQGHLEELGF
jgi:RNA polymerase sigma factor (sigma-70 family)